MQRREFLQLTAAAAGGLRLRLPWQEVAPDATLTIATAAIEIAQKHTFKTTCYNGAVPGPLLRMREGQSFTALVNNRTNAQELVHWHGFKIPSSVDGATEEGTPAIAADGSHSYSFTAGPAGLRWYHTHGFAGRDLGKATFSGQLGIAYIAPRSEPGDFDAEFFLTLHGWDPYLSTNFAAEGTLEAWYKFHTVNGRCLGAGEPLRVKAGQRVRLQIVNASATLTHTLALPGHRFEVVALDGNSVPAPTTVETLVLGPAERITMIVTMNQPGVWTLGEVDDPTRKTGLGIVVEYTGQSGAPQWFRGGQAPTADWDYLKFGVVPPQPRPVAEPRRLVFQRKFAGTNWIDSWTINGKSWPKTDPIRVSAGNRYRLIFDNQSDDPHPVHLHRHSFEIVSVAGRPTGGVMKDVVVCPPRQVLEVELTADNPGPTLFHCHQQMHMDAGFMAMLEYD